jgi:RNA polymerase sigma-70 factor (ECF subfamily)
MRIAMAESRPPPTGRLRLVHRAPADEPGDTELCRAFMAGDEAAFGELIRRHQDLVFDIVRRYTTHADDARDLSQRAFLKAFQAAHKATAGVPSALETMEVSERERLARAAVLKLPKGQREVLTLRIDAELAFAEIAEVLGISENNAKVHFHHAVKRLKLLIGQNVSEEPL